MTEKPIKTWMGVPHAFLRRILVLSVIGFPFVGSSISPLLRSKPVPAKKCEAEKAKKQEQKPCDPPKS